MAARRGDTLLFPTPPVVAAHAAIGGKKEGEGPLAACFDELSADNFFGQSNFKALFGEKALPVYSVIVVLFILVGSTLKVDLVWAMADFFNGLMAVPNLLALLALSGVVAAIDKE